VRGQRGRLREPERVPEPRGQRQPVAQPRPDERGERPVRLPDPDPDADADPHADADPDPDANPHTDAHADPDADPDANPLPDRDADPDTDGRRLVEPGYLRVEPRTSIGG
jgi:hypothetical protein